MARLKDRSRDIPNGFRFFQPETRWEPPRYRSFRDTVNSIITYRKGNTALIQKHGWATAYDAVADELDRYNTKLCQQMGWNNFVTEGGGAAAAAAPFPRPLPNRLRSVAAGGNLLVEWIRDEHEAVDKALANNRAAICANCPMNGKGDFTRWFTVPVSEAIRNEINRKESMRLTTDYDDKIEVCEACLCPLKLKVHMPIGRIRANITAEAHNQLYQGCWILHEP